MNQVEIIKAILAGEELECRSSASAGWRTFIGGETPDESLTTYLGAYMTTSFRLKLKPKTYQSRAYIINEANIFHWVSTNSASQEDHLRMYGNQARWIEDTQTKEYV